nr:reverse transcriptase domain-containing protein [Tanacetum cinerariifolium]
MPNHQEFFLPEEFSSPKKQGHDQSSSSTSTLPQAFEIGESSRKTSLERHEEQIEGILNHLDELSLDRIKHIEDKLEGLGQASVASASEAPAMTQAAIRKLVVDSVSIALETQAATMANAGNANRNPEPKEAPVARKCSYKEFMSCQPFNFKGSKGAIRLICWFKRTESVFSCSNCTEDCKVEFKKLWMKKYCPRTEIQKMEDEFYHLTVNVNDLKTYVRRFQELAILCPTMVSDFEKLLEAFIEGLPRSIKGNVTASKPQTLEEAINIAQRLMGQVGHSTKNCQNKRPTTGSNQLPVTVICHVLMSMEKKGHYKNQCQKTDINAQGRAYLLRDRNAHQDPNVVPVSTLSSVLTGFPSIIEKVVHIPIDVETLIIRVMEKKSDEKRLKDIPVVKEYLDVFPEDLPGLPFVRQVEFQIDLISGTSPVARAPYRLAPSEMHELSN